MSEKSIISMPCNEFIMNIFKLHLEEIDSFDDSLTETQIKCKSILHTSHSIL